jgi:hypothetical protein
MSNSPEAISLRLESRSDRRRLEGRILPLRLYSFSLGFELEMSLGFSRFGLWVVLLGLVASGIGESCVFAQGRIRPRRSIELSETNSPEILTNLNQITSKKEGVRQLEDQLRTLNSFSTANSLQGDFPTPYASPNAPLPKRTLKELIERQKNWGLTAEELGTATADQESLIWSGEEKGEGKKSSLEQFYDTLNHSGPSANRTAEASKQSNWARDRDSLDDASLPPGLQDKARMLKEMVNDDGNGIFGSDKSRSSFDNFFGLDTVAPEPAGAKTSMDSFLNQFKRVLDGQSVESKLDPTVNALLPEIGERRSPSYPGLDPLPTSSKREVTQAPTPTPGNVNSLVDRTTLPDVNATILNQWNSMYTAPKVEVPKYSPPTPPNMEFPRRRF